MTHFIKPEYLTSLYLILNNKEEVSLKDLGDYAVKLNRELIERKIEAVFLYSDKYIEEMFSDYKDYFEYNDLYEDVSSPDYCTPWIKRKVPIEVLSEKFTAYLSNDVAKVACDLKTKETIMTTEEMIEIMNAYKSGKKIEIKIKNVENDEWNDITFPRWNWDMYDYRIKAEPTYRPYHSDEEMLDDIKKRLDENCGSIQHPVISGIWLKTKNTNSKNMIIGYNATGINLYDSSKSQESFSWTTAYYNFTYLDDTPFGKKE